MLFSKTHHKQPSHGGFLSIVAASLVVAAFGALVLPGSALAASPSTNAHAPEAAPVSMALPVTSGSFASRNWSGYMAKGAAGTYSGVGSGWVIPTASGTSYSSDAAWVGIGGAGKLDLIQVGTQALANAGGTSFTYRAWYELLPSAPVIIPVPVRPGDSVTASVVRQSQDQWLVSFTNVTTGQGFKAVVQYASSMSSAEWIQEMPLATGMSQFVPLDDFGTISFSNAWASIGSSRKSISQLGGSAVSMLTGSNQQLALTSRLGIGGSSFSVTRTGVPVPAMTSVALGTHVGGVTAGRLASR